METLSARAQQMSSNMSGLLGNFMKLQKNTYDDELNPGGICNLGVAENYLCENELVAKLQSVQIWKTSHIYYPNPLGLPFFRKTLCDFFRRIFHLNEALDPNRMLVSSGLSGVVSLLSFLIGNPDDVFLIAAPYYTAFDHDVSALSNCATFRCPLLEQETGQFVFSVEIFRRGYGEAVSKGLRPRGIILVNPHNPTGDVYDEQTIQSVLQFAADKQLHMIVDEIYALSLFEGEKPFESVLKYSHIVDPERTHFVWSFSKDFALSGLRLGVLYAGSEAMCTAGSAVNFLQVPSTIIQDIAAAMIADHAWIDSYVELNRSRLTKRYETIKRKIEELDERITVRPAHAGFFIWSDFRRLLHEQTFAEEKRLFQIIFDHGVYLSAGNFLGCEQPGWFRLIYSVREPWIAEGIRRLKLALDAYEHSPVPSKA